MDLFLFWLFKKSRRGSECDASRPSVAGENDLYALVRKFFRDLEVTFFAELSDLYNKTCIMI